MPANGSDYVRLRDATDAYLDVGDVDSIQFNGASKLAKLPVQWKVDKCPPKGGPSRALYSGKGDNIDRRSLAEVQVDNGALDVDMAWTTEEGYDYAYVQVSTDGGKKYKSVHCTDSIDAPLGPGFDGNSGGATSRFVSERCNLHKYAGDKVILAFRYVTDGGVILPGFWVDDVSLDGQSISNGTCLKGWKSITQIHPVDVKNWFVRLVAIDETANQVRIGIAPAERRLRRVDLSGADLDAFIGTTAEHRRCHRDVPGPHRAGPADGAVHPQRERRRAAGRLDRARVPARGRVARTRPRAVGTRPRDAGSPRVRGPAPRALDPPPR